MSAHAVLGASSADRWMNCPGSVRLSRGLPESPSIFAAEGTAAHEIAQRCLENDHATAEFYRGETIPVEEWSFDVDDDMIDAVDVYLAEVARIREEAPDIKEWVERRFSLESLRPPSPMFGTADWTAYSRATRTLYVRDYKHGRGKVVRAEGNTQMRYYALGALLSLPAGYPVRHVDMGIVQPRAGNVSSETIDAELLLEFASVILDAAKATEAGDAPTVPGEWCQWCKAKAVCPSLKSQALAVAQAEFGTPPAPHSLSPEHLAAVLEKADVIEAWINAVRAHAFREAEQGRTPPGYKLVAKRATRKWAEADGAIVATLQVHAGAALDPNDLFEHKLVSPAQAEKLLKAAKLKLPDGLTNAISSGYNLVPEADKRPAVNLLSASDEFGALPSVDP